MAHPIYKASDGKRIPSVTTILSKFKDPGGLMHWAWSEGIEGRDYRKTRDKAANAGTLCHDMSEAWLRGWEWSPPEDVDSDDLAKAEKGFEGLREWAAGTKLEVVESEVSLVSDEHRFGGSLDYLGRVNEKLVILDLKTSNRIYEDYLVQVAAYRYLWEHGLLNDRKAPVPEDIGKPIEGLHLLRVGKVWGDFHHHSWPIEVLDVAFSQFLDLLRCYRRSNDKLKRAV